METLTRDLLCTASQSEVNHVTSTKSCNVESNVKQQTEFWSVEGHENNDPGKPKPKLKMPQQDNMPVFD